MDVRMRRYLLIAVIAVVVILLIFLISRMMRGSNRVSVTKVGDKKIENVNIPLEEIQKNNDAYYEDFKKRALQGEFGECPICNDIETNPYKGGICPKCQSEALNCTLCDWTINYEGTEE